MAEKLPGSCSFLAVMKFVHTEHFEGLTVTSECHDDERLFVLPYHF